MGDRTQNRKIFGPTEGTILTPADIANITADLDNAVGLIFRALGGYNFIPAAQPLTIVPGNGMDVVAGSGGSGNAIVQGRYLDLCPQTTLPIAQAGTSDRVDLIAIQATRGPGSNMVTRTVVPDNAPLNELPLKLTLVNGSATFAFSPAFVAIPVVELGVEGADGTASLSLAITAQSVTVTSSDPSDSRTVDLNVQGNAPGSSGSSVTWALLENRPAWQVVTGSSTATPQTPPGYEAFAVVRVRANATSIAATDITPLFATLVSPVLDATFRNLTATSLDVASGILSPGGGIFGHTLFSDVGTNGYGQITLVDRVNSTHPSKSLRSNGTDGCLEVVNDAQNGVILTLTDAGALSVPGDVSSNGTMHAYGFDTHVPGGPNSEYYSSGASVGGPIASAVALALVSAGITGNAGIASLDTTQGSPRLYLDERSNSAPAWQYRFGIDSFAGAMRFLVTGAGQNESSPSTWTPDGTYHVGSSTYGEAALVDGTLTVHGATTLAGLTAAGILSTHGGTINGGATDVFVVNVPMTATAGLNSPAGGIFGHTQFTGDGTNGYGQLTLADTVHTGQRPTKQLRGNGTNGCLEVVNDARNGVILTLSDAGVLGVSSITTVGPIATSAGANDGIASLDTTAGSPRLYLDARANSSAAAQVRFGLDVFAGTMRMLVTPASANESNPATWRSDGTFLVGGSAYGPGGATIAAPGKNGAGQIKLVDTSGGTAPTKALRANGATNAFEIINDGENAVIFSVSDAGGTSSNYTSSNGTVRFVDANGKTDVTTPVPSFSYGAHTVTGSDGSVSVQVPYQIIGATANYSANTTDNRNFSCQVDQQRSNFGAGIAVFKAVDGTNAIGGIGIYYTVVTNTTPHS